MRGDISSVPARVLKDWYLDPWSCLRGGRMKYRMGWRAIPPLAALVMVQAGQA